MFIRCSNSALIFSRRHTETHTDSNRCHSERDCHRSTTTQLWNADMLSWNHTKAFVKCCHSKHTVVSSRTLLSGRVYISLQLILLFICIISVLLTSHFFSLIL